MGGYLPLPPLTSNSFQEAIRLVPQAIDGLGQGFSAPDHPHGAGAGQGRGLGQMRHTAGYLAGLMGHFVDIGGNIAGGGFLLLDGAGDGQLAL